MKLGSRFIATLLLVVCCGVIGASIRETAKNPLDAADTYYKTATLKTAITSMVTVVVLYVLVSVFNLLGNVWHILAIAKRSYGAFAYHYVDKGDILRYAKTISYRDTDILEDTGGELPLY